ncbi:MAG: hypothetical protein J0I34_05540 [Pseudonocardia sp.]|uniref:hypothetical protein n=1 Tax=unclassified Pseudonocardia TaxID=2619320 RepID=UPI00086EEFAB|nr:MULTISPECIES: hypothetical protein [unclassified Pseudonocardia]MBN9108227.1 hypothetical protein [Pseudonocardia sp.]ODU25928.1 MAG: hypothetical protein ABS80_08605 [Pseudonocardia sp. SCN 72-51]ODV08630.1 MAG: hypothetical protein ABT15_02010 [Pseudonocardia sp. SCN 73-27]
MTALLSDRPATPAAFPSHRRVTAYVAGGLDGVLRVVSMLRGRGYKVRDLSVQVCDGVVESAVSCTVALTAAETTLLVQRLRRMPAVVSADEV